MNTDGQLQPLIIILFLSFSLVTATINTLSLRRFNQYPTSMSLPSVSVLIPARNEAGNIEACVTAFLSQEYPHFEVLVLNDHSTDGTMEILTRLASQNPRLRVLEGLPLPAGWHGKHWACHQLSRAATGELILFTDADTRHGSTTLRDSVSALLAEKADLVTAFPREEVVSWGERLIVPVIGFGIISFLPIYLVRHLKWPTLSVTIGQFMLFRREAYKAIGGYESVRNHLVDDVSLGRLILAHDYQWRLMDGTGHVTCRMHHNFSEAVEGFTKNAFAFFDYRLLPFFTILALLIFVFIKPLWALLTWNLGAQGVSFPPNLAGIAVLESLLLWWIAYRRFKIPSYLVLLYPFSLILIILIALRSVVLTLTGSATWKDRKLERASVRWI